MPDLGICVVNWNTRDLLDRCLQSIREHAEDLAVEVVVVDNASSDGSADMVRERHPWVRLLANEENCYYAAGNNQGLRALETPLKLLLNPDIEVHAGSLQTLVQFLHEHPQAGAAAPRLRGPAGEVQFTCRSFPGPDVVVYEALGLSRLFPRSRWFGKYRMSWWNYDETRAVDQPMASALLVRDKALGQVGLFDEQFPMFFNDVDLCRRLWDAGWEVWFTPVAEMTHLGGAATRQVRREMIIASHRSFLAYYRKHYRGKVSPIAYAAAVLLLTLGLYVRLATTAVGAMGLRGR
ncbi:glycosyltransferase family 2 protein [bacterium]|nr:glycosyltransferase family 2 protein [bacterium]